MTNAIKQAIKNWIKEYEDNEEHDNELSVELKDSAYELLKDLLLED